MVTGNVFNIEHFAIHDGPGIRTTVFLKGCPLACIWCHNPEGLSTSPQMLHRTDKCTLCGRCVRACPRGALSVDGTRGWVIDRDKCDHCGLCEKACLMNAIETVGREMTAEEVMDDVEGDRLFYDQSGGGVTFSGGEPLLQWEFLEACLKRAKEKGFHTAIETSGFAPREAVERVAPFTDLFLYDLKHIAKEGSLKYTGVDNRIAKENLRWLSGRGSRIIVRTVVVPGANADGETLEGFADFFDSLPQIETVNILPLHKSASEKYNRLDKKFLIADYRVPTEEEMEEVAQFYRDRGFDVKIGG